MVDFAWLPRQMSLWFQKYLYAVPHDPVQLNRGSHGAKLY